MSLEKNGVVPRYTIIQADGLYPDDTIEYEIFKPKGFHVNYVQTNLWPTGSPEGKPWSAIDKKLRDQVDGITVLKLGFSAEDLELFPQLKVVVRMGVGYDKLDRAALAKRGVTVCNVPDYGTCEIADHAVALALSLRRGIALYHDTQRDTTPAHWMPIETPLISRLQNTTFGILGLGPIGMAVAQRVKAFGWNVLFYDPYAPTGIEKSLGLARTKNIEDFFRRVSTVSVHCPLNRQTRGMIGDELLRLMPPGAVLVNTARGEIVDLDAVERCLKEGILAGAGLDVLPEEPIPNDHVHPLLLAYRKKEQWLAGRLVLTPHVAWHSPESLVDIRVKSAETMRDVLLEGLHTNVIQPSRD